MNDLLDDLLAAMAAPDYSRSAPRKVSLADLLPTLTHAGVDAPTVPVAVPDHRPAPKLAAMITEQHSADPDRLPWPDDWFTRRDPLDALMCQRMWADVLRHQLVDAVKDRITAAERLAQKRGQPAPAVDMADRSVTDGWLGSRDFHMVAQLAGLDGTAVFEVILRRCATYAGAVALKLDIAPQYGKLNRKDAA